MTKDIPQSDLTIQEMYFLSIIVQMWHDLHTKTVNSCGTVRPNQKGMSWNFGKKLKLKWCDRDLG
jgi:hypothetical protein